MFCPNENRSNGDLIMNERREEYRLRKAELEVLSEDELRAIFKTSFGRLKDHIDAAVPSKLVDTILQKEFPVIHH
jgi:hypothetical protein